PNSKSPASQAPCRPVASSRRQASPRISCWSNSRGRRPRACRRLRRASSCACIATMRLERYAWLSVAAAVATISLKALAWRLTDGVAIGLLRVGREHHSITLEADGRHLMTDVWTSAAVIAGVALVYITGWLRLDALIALAVSAHILWTGFGLVRRSVRGLLDP